MKTTQALVKQAVQRKAEKKVVAPLEEVVKVELEKVPESQLKRPQAKGWVKQEGMVSAQDKEDDMRKAFQARMATAKQDEERTTASSTPTIKTKRELPSIPGGAQKAEPAAAKEEEDAVFCPYCGKDLTWIYCPYCGEKLPHSIK